MKEPRCRVPQRPELILILSLSGSQILVSGSDARSFLLESNILWIVDECALLDLKSTLLVSRRGVSGIGQPLESMAVAGKAYVPSPRSFLLMDIVLLHGKSNRKTLFSSYEGKHDHKFVYYLLVAMFAPSTQTLFPSKERALKDPRQLIEEVANFYFKLTTKK